MKFPWKIKVLHAAHGERHVELLLDYSEVTALTHFGRYHFSSLKIGRGEQVTFTPCGKVANHPGAFWA